jgi:hypothetical protein
MLSQAKDLNFAFTAVSDIWSRRRDEAKAALAQRDISVDLYRNNEELYEKSNVDAVIIGTADFQHALHTIEAVEAGKMFMLKSHLPKQWKITAKLGLPWSEPARIVTIGSQRRSAANYHAANEFIRSGQVWRHSNGGNDLECESAGQVEKTEACCGYKGAGHGLEKVPYEQAL